MKLRGFVIFSFLAILVIFRIYQNGSSEASFSQKSRQNTNSEFLNEDSTFLLPNPVNFQKYLTSKIKEIIPAPQAALLSGMLIGYQSDLPRDLKQALKNTSTIHTVVVSGQNLTIVAGLIFVFVSFLGRKTTLTLATLIVIFYSYLTGFQVPVIRAAIMVELSFIVQFFGKERESWWIILLTALIMLIYDPSWLFSVSFQLSFLATIGVVVLAPEIVRRLGFLPELIKKDLGVSIATQALTWPIIAFNFHQFSLLGILVNALILWTVSFIMISGAIALLVSFLSLSLAHFLALVPLTLLTYFLDIVNFFNQIPYSYVKVEDSSIITLVGYYFLIISIYLFLKIKLKIQKG